MRVSVYNHQNKATGIADAIRSQGHELTNLQSADILLIDHDGPQYYRDIIDYAERCKIPVWLYSHGANSCMAWDGWWEPHPWTSGYLANAPGHKEIMKRYGYPKPVHVIGWHWCEKIIPQPRPPVTSVLFAPIHPLGNGFMRPEARAANGQAFARLLATGYQIRLRYIGSLEAQGLWEEPGVEYEMGQPDNTTLSIDRAECVVSWGTFAHLAVARGKPVVFYGQDDIPGDGHSADGMRYVRHWKKYKNLLRYPIDLCDGNARDQMQAAARSDVATFEWIANFIGLQLNPLRLSRLLEELANVRVHV